MSNHGAQAEAHFYCEQVYCQEQGRGEDIAQPLRSALLV